MDMVAAKRTTADFPYADILNPEHVKTMTEAAEMLEEDIALGGYTKTKFEAQDRRQLVKLRKWLALVRKS